MQHLPADPASMRRGLVIILLFAGIALRLLHRNVVGSDVLETTYAAIATVLDGGNPYGHGYSISRPPGAPYAYGPFALVWYAVLPRTIELLASTAVLFILAWAERIVGLAICALWVPLAVLANDGSNDSSVGLLLLGALVLAERSPRLGAGALALVVAFKPYALAFLPPLVAFGGLSVLVPFAAVSLVAWGPAIALWGAGSILTSFRMATQVHPLPYYSLAAILRAQPPASPIFLVIQLVCGAFATIGSLIWARTARSMVAWGIVIFVATLYTGWWSTAAYWAAVVPIAAWHIDAWLREARPLHGLAALLTGRPQRKEVGTDPENQAGNQAGGGAVPAA
jgi:hypothetical protein